MAIFWRLLLGHLLADFTLQTNFINRWKRSSLVGMLAHCVMHPVCCAALTWPYLGETWSVLGELPLPGWACVLLLFAVHFLADQWRVMMIFKHKAPDNTLSFVWDQVIHGAVIFALFPLGPGSGLFAGPERWPVLACLLIFLTDACAVTLYFLEKDLYGTGFPRFDEKLVGMLERLVLALCFLLPRGGWLTAAPLWLAVMFGLRARRLLDLTWFSLGFGAVAGVLGGLFARAAYFY
ncbi:MAG: DUF3307 domain-containing protein [Elusimicrobia bacterium]|nr:DUF3307 domain-containing protein [Elusimicrobiota bacterium]